MVGSARRNEYSTASTFDMPTPIAPIMVAAALETPGMTERDWQSPIMIAFMGVSVVNLFVSGFGFMILSIKRSTMPPRNNAATATYGFPVEIVL